MGGEGGNSAEGHGRVGGVDILRLTATFSGNFLFFNDDNRFLIDMFKIYYGDDIAYTKRVTLLLFYSGYCCYPSSLLMKVVVRTEEKVKVILLFSQCGDYLLSTSNVINLLCRILTNVMKKLVSFPRVKYCSY